VNGTVRPLKTRLEIKKDGSALSVELVNPVKLSISDLGFGDRTYALLKACNHKSMGNVVDLNASRKFE